MIIREKSSIFPDKKFVIPGSLDKFITLCTTGLLRSVSINKVFLPKLAYVIAILATVVVFPSPGPALETSIDFIFLSISVNNIFVRRLLYASEIGERGSSLVIRVLSILLCFDFSFG